MESNSVHDGCTQIKKLKYYIYTYYIYGYYNILL